jgi:hypothetical protein
MGSLLARVANSSIKVSMTKVLWVYPTDLNEWTGTLIFLADDPDPEAGRKRR